MVSARLAFAFLALIAAQAALAQGGHDHRHGSGARAELGASAAFDAKGALWAVGKEGGHVMLRRSEDLGRSWSQPASVNTVPEAIGADGDARPKIAAGPGGELYVTWTKPLAKPFTGEIRFSRSLDGGRTFSAPLTVHADRQEITHRFDSIAVTGDGRIFIAWIDKRDGVAAAREKLPYRGAAVYFAVSNDRGESFRGDYKLADHSCECCRIAVLSMGDGSVLAMWRHVFAPNIRDHAIARMFPDGRVEKERRTTFDDWRLDACPHHGPSLAADAAGRLHAVWFSQALGREGVFYARLREGAVDAERRIGGEAAEHADLAVAGQRIAIAWKEFDGERTRLRAMRSENGGEHWREFQLASTDGASDQPRVLVFADRFYVFWNTRNEPLSVEPLP